MIRSLWTRRLAVVRSLVLAIAVAGITTAAVAAAPAPGTSRHAELAAYSYCPDGEDLAFLSLINQYRADNGLPALSLSRALGAAANRHSRDMARYNYFSHTLHNGTSWLQNIRNYGYGYRTSLGENIAAGQSAASATFNQWVNSAPHRRNMLRGNYTAIGIGRAYRSSARYGWYWTTTFGGVADDGPSC